MATVALFVSFNATALLEVLPFFDSPPLAVDFTEGFEADGEPAFLSPSLTALPAAARIVDFSFVLPKSSGTSAVTFFRFGVVDFAFAFCVSLPVSFLSLSCRVSIAFRSSDTVFLEGSVSSAVAALTVFLTRTGLASLGASDGFPLAAGTSEIVGSGFFGCLAVPSLTGEMLRDLRTGDTDLDCCGCCC